MNLDAKEQECLQSDIHMLGSKSSGVGHLFYKLSEQGIPDVPGAVVILEAPVLRLWRLRPRSLLKFCTCAQ